jgi:hypothetical protein
LTFDARCTIKELLHDPGVGEQMLRDLRGDQARFTRGHRHRQHKLIGQMRIDRSSALVVR